MSSTHISFILDKTREHPTCTECRIRPEVIDSVNWKTLYICFPSVYRAFNLEPSQKNSLRKVLESFIICSAYKTIRNRFEKEESSAYQRMTNVIVRNLQEKKCSLNPRRDESSSNFGSVLQARAKELLAQVESRGLKYALHELLREKCEREAQAATEIQEIKFALRDILDENDRLLADMMGIIDESNARKHECDYLDKENKRLKVENERLKKALEAKDKTSISGDLANYEMNVANSKIVLQGQTNVVEGQKRHVEETVLKSGDEAETAQNALRSAVNDIDRIRLQCMNCTCNCALKAKESLDSLLRKNMMCPVIDTFQEIGKNGSNKLLKTGGCFTSANEPIAQPNLMSKLGKPLPLSKHGSERLHQLRRMRFARQQSLRCSSEKMLHSSITTVHEVSLDLNDADNEVEKRPSSPTSVIQNDTKSLASASAKTKLESSSITFDQWYSGSASETSNIFDRKKERRALRKRFYYGYLNKNELIETCPEVAEDESDTSSEEGLFTIRVSSLRDLDDISSCMTDSACTTESSIQL